MHTCMFVGENGRTKEKDVYYMKAKLSKRKENKVPSGIVGEKGKGKRKCILYQNEIVKKERNKVSSGRGK